MSIAPVRDDYTSFCEGVRRIAGVDLLQYKRGQMERRIRTYVQRRGGDDLSGYLAELRRSEDELAGFLDRVTINVSQLWRHPEQWRVLAQTVLPELGGPGRTLRAWSAGCSYGAEAYTLAAVCREAIPATKVEIKGTDIDRRMVERARAGAFDDKDAREAPSADIARWFERTEEGFAARDELKAMVRFEVGDLLQMPMAENRFDLVLCRNTVIYFTDEVRDRLHTRLVDSLRPGGYLVVGATERVSTRAVPSARPAHPFVYRKAA